MNAISRIAFRLANSIAIVALVPPILIFFVVTGQVRRAIYGAEDALLTLIGKNPM